tara:strand:- start:389 stop:1069 length:681 start_codon:yes stop_codon:yes gene_type:complete
MNSVENRSYALSRHNLIRQQTKFEEQNENEKINDRLNQIKPNIEKENTYAKNKIVAINKIYKDSYLSDYKKLFSEFMIWPFHWPFKNEISYGEKINAMQRLLIFIVINVILFLILIQYIKTKTKMDIGNVNQFILVSKIIIGVCLVTFLIVDFYQRYRINKRLQSNQNIIRRNNDLKQQVKKQMRTDMNKYDFITYGGRVSTENLIRNPIRQKSNTATHLSAVDII